MGDWTCIRARVLCGYEKDTRTTSWHGTVPAPIVGQLLQWSVPALFYRRQKSHRGYCHNSFSGGHDMYSMLNYRPEV